MSARVAPEAADVLRRSTVSGCILRLPEGQLDRTTYAAVDKVLKLLGGKWDRRQGGHVFSFDPSDKLAEALGGGKVVSRQQTLQHFDTPEHLADELVAAIGVGEGDTCLEPSAGIGRIVAALAKRNPTKIIAVEIDPDNGRQIERQGLAHNLIVGDFLDFHPADGLVSAIAMNPPFCANQDIRHVQRAFSMLAPGGRLAAIVSEHGFLGKERECSEWRDWLAANDAEVCIIKAGKFKESGTAIQTRMVVIRRAM